PGREVSCRLPPPIMQGQMDNPGRGIIKEISACFLFFKDGYQGWKDSIRHNLSSNDCFRKVLKDPSKPQAKGNFWTVDVRRIPPEALRVQNTPISRQEDGVFPADLSPFVFNGLPFSLRPSQAPLHNLAAAQESPFDMENLLSDVREVGLPACGPVPIFRANAGGTLQPWRGPLPFPSNSGPAGRARPKRGLPKRARDPASSSSDSDSSGTGVDPAPSALRLEQLPTSYTKSVAPNVVAPPSHGLPLAFAGGSSASFYGPMPTFPGPVYWDLMPRPALSPVLSSASLLDLDQTMPPNKSIFDVWVANPSDTIPPVVSMGQLWPPSRCFG
uniref:Fork-head domain-containing protein n=1 Tax=Anolis carolinensis TaxID=28377 RepID=H9GR64_ANOCA